jgi:uncharacterized protein with PIN domain
MAEEEERSTHSAVVATQQETQQAAAEQQPAAEQPAATTSASTTAERMVLTERKRRKEKKRIKREAKHQRDLIVRYECEDCGKDLNAYEAFYHWSGPGPLCYECIEADEELSGYKWEAKPELSR